MARLQRCRYEGDCRDADSLAGMNEASRRNLDDQTRPSDLSGTPVPEPRWPAVVATLALGCLYAALPRTLVGGPSWLPLALLCALLVPAIIFNRRGRHHHSQVLGYIMNGIAT